MTPADLTRALTLPLPPDAERSRVEIIKRGLKDTPCTGIYTYAQAYVACYGQPVELRHVPRLADGQPDRGKET